MGIVEAVGGSSTSLAHGEQQLLAVTNCKPICDLCIELFVRTLSISGLSVRFELLVGFRILCFEQEPAETTSMNLLVSKLTYSSPVSFY